MGALRILLDTCTFLWLTVKPAKIGPAAAKAIDAPGSALVLSDCSIWELCLKWETGKIQLPDPPRLWIESQRSLWRLTGLRVEREHFYRVTELPRHHRDPFDRLLVAQAIEEGLTIATPDPSILCYPVSTIW